MARGRLGEMMKPKTNQVARGLVAALAAVVMTTSMVARR
jgi:hypothetical protein